MRKPDFIRAPHSQHDAAPADEALQTAAVLAQVPALVPATSRRLLPSLRTIGGFGVGLTFGAAMAWIMANWSAPNALPGVVAGQEAQLATAVTVSADLSRPAATAAASSAPRIDATAPLALAGSAPDVGADTGAGAPAPAGNTIADPAPLALAVPRADAPPPQPGTVPAPVEVAALVPAGIAGVGPREAHVATGSRAGDLSPGTLVPAALPLASAENVIAPPAAPLPISDGWRPLPPSAVAVQMVLPPSGGKKRSERAATSLADEGYGIAESIRADKALKVPEVHYFRAADARIAADIAALLAIDAVTLSDKANARPGQIEVWLAALPATDPPAKKKKQGTARSSAKGIPAMPEDVQMQILRDRILSQLN